MLLLVFLRGLFAVLGELSVEDDFRRWEVEFLDESCRLRSTVDSVHCTIFPFDTQRTGISDVIEGTNDGLEVDHSSPDRLEVPVTAWLVEIDVTAENTSCTITDSPGNILHVDMEDAFLELIDELHIIDALIAEVARVVVEAKRRVEFHCLQSTLCTGDIKRDFGGMHLEREAHTFHFKRVEDWLEAFGEVGVTGFDLSIQIRREGIDQMPDAAAGETIDHGDAEKLRRTSCFDELMGSASAHTLWFTITVDVIWQNLFVTFIDVVTHRLTDEMTAECMTLEPIPSELELEVRDVFLVSESLVDVEVVSPARKFHALITHLPGQFEKLVEFEVCPLTRKECQDTSARKPTELRFTVG